MEDTNYHSVDFQNVCLSCRLDSPERKSFLSVLESCIDVLTIHQRTLTNYHSSSYNQRIYLDRLERMNKLQQDCEHVRELLEAIKNQVEKEGSFSALIKLIEENAQRAKEENDILVNYEEAQKAVKGLQKTLEDVTIEQDEEIEALKTELINLREEREKLESKANVETKYITAWEKARCEQSSRRCSIILEDLKTSLQDCLIQEKNERQIARDIQAFIKQNIAFNKQAAVHWRERHVREMQMYEEKNNRLNNDIEMKRNTLEILESKFKSRQDFIDAYLAEKEAVRIQKELEEHQRGCAIKIQSWWRGVMVRRKLGPYRPDEKKKKRSVKTKK